MCPDVCGGCGWLKQTHFILHTSRLEKSLHIEGRVFIEAVWLLENCEWNSRLLWLGRGPKAIGFDEYTTASAGNFHLNILTWTWKGVSCLSSDCNSSIFILESTVTEGSQFNSVKFKWSGPQTVRCVWRCLLQFMVELESRKDSALVAYIKRNYYSNWTD